MVWNPAMAACKRSMGSSSDVRWRPLVSERLVCYPINNRIQMMMERLLMATATLKKRPRKSKAPALDQAESLEEDRSASFFMPAGSMTLDDFRKWTSADDFPENGKIAYIGQEIFIDMS